MTSQFKKLATLFDRRDKLRLLGLLGLMIIGSLLDVIGVGAIPAFVAALALPEQVLAYPVAGDFLRAVGITTARQLVIWGSLGLIFIFAVKNAFLSLIQYVQIRTAEKYHIRLAHHMFEAYMNAPYEFHMGRNSAELLRNVNLETREVVHGVLNPLLSVVMSLLMTVFIVLLILLTTPLIAFLGIGIVAVGSWLFLRTNKDRMLRYGEEARDRRREGFQAINQGIGGLLDARIHGREPFFIDVFHHSMQRLAIAERLRQFVAKVTSPVLETIAVAGLLLIVLTIALTSSSMTTLIPTLALFGAAIVRLRATVSQVVGGISQIRYSIVSVDSLYDDLALLEEDISIGKPGTSLAARKPEEVLRLHHALVLDGITYAYPNMETPALRNISLTIDKGSSIAFVGSTGSGKTTLVNVLLGLLKPQQGTIAVDGVDIHTNLRGWHANIGYIPQTIFLLDDTIRRNIAFGLRDDEIEDDKLWTSIQAAQLEEFVLGLDEGVDAFVGERGVRLSGGQRQRIGLARALYHNPDVLIMDEATSSLDNHTESLVIKALEDLKKERTFIMIAHRLSTVRNCDRLYFMKDGHIEAEGSYEELSHVHHDFRKMAEML